MILFDFSFVVLPMIFFFSCFFLVNYVYGQSYHESCLLEASEGFFKLEERRMRKLAKSLLEASKGFFKLEEE
jgi:hypothetical protein